jgi:hypothetical protein
MKYNKIFWIGAITFAGLTGCKKYVEKGNVNINPNQPSFVTLNTLLPAVADATANNHALVAFITSMFSQQMAAYTSGPINEDRHIDVRISTAYSGLYQRGMTNSKILLEMARTQGSPYYMAIARILFVTNLALATDTYGDVPLKEAFQATAILQPKHDKQEDIYAFIHSYLDSAITETGLTNPTSLKPGIDDLVFAGDMNSWKQTAWFLKARLYMHTTKRGVAAATTSAITALANAYTASSKPFQITYNDRNNSPWFVTVSGRIAGSQVFTIGPSKRFVDAISGIAYPGLVDPRIDALMARSGSNPIYSGIPNGFGNTTNNTNFTDATFFGKKSSPLLMGSYAEQKLMEAEALFLANGGTATSIGSTQAAYDAYIEGISANFKYLGISSAAYLTNPQVAVTPAGLTLELILREKQVALYLNPEAWTDVRRYDYNPNLFRGMALPVNHNPELGGNYIRRALYPLDEVNRNPNAQAALKPLSDKVWWDQ